uniref:Uncharacterized protein n=1 Tax=Sus scrofa TaxID=9823 RepID=A0A8D1VQJ1_PIG
MEQTVPRCVREPWDSAEDSQEPEALQILSSGDPGGWRLPLYPSLGQLSWDDQDVSRELLSTPCGLLRPFCPKHGPRAQSACRPSAEPEQSQGKYKRFISTNTVILKISQLP